MDEDGDKVTSVALRRATGKPIDPDSAEHKLLELLPRLTWIDPPDSLGVIDAPKVVEVAEGKKAATGLYKTDGSMRAAFSKLTRDPPDGVFVTKEYAWVTGPAAVFYGSG
jgi:hypothetical protein